MNRETVTKFESRIKKWSTIICDLLELVVATVVAIAAFIAVISLFPELAVLVSQDGNVQAFAHFLESALTVVVGIEFLKMLCRPNSDNVLETIIFLAARHMIINVTSPLEDLLSTLSIVLLCLVRRYLNNTRDGEEKNQILAKIRKKQGQSGHPGETGAAEGTETDSEV